MREKLLALLEPEVEAMGYLLIDVEYITGGGGVLRLYIDHADGIGVDDCGRVSEQVSAVLDVEDPIPGNYNLEVSSPGEDRPLRTREHFASQQGEEIKVELGIPLDGRRRFRGTLERVDEEQIEMLVDGESYLLTLAHIQRARLAPRR